MLNDRSDVLIIPVLTRCNFNTVSLTSKKFFSGGSRGVVVVSSGYLAKNTEIRIWGGRVCRRWLEVATTLVAASMCCMYLIMDFFLVQKTVVSKASSISALYYESGEKVYEKLYHDSASSLISSSTAINRISNSFLLSTFCLMLFIRWSILRLSLSVLSYSGRVID